MFRLGNIHDLNRSKAIRSARRDLKAGNSVWFINKTSYSVKKTAFPSVSGRIAIKEFQALGHCMAYHLKEAANLYGANRGEGVWTQKFNENKCQYETVYENYCTWMYHGQMLPITFLLSQSELFTYKGYKSDPLKQWLACLKKWNDYLVNLKGYAKKVDFNQIKKRAVTDISKYSKENPMERSLLANYFLPLAFGGRSAEAAGRYDAFRKIVGEMLKLQPLFNQAAQTIIDDAKRP